MYIWIPNTQEEMTFVEQEIISKQSEQVWIGVVDKPNGNCLLSDYKTKCPFTKYAHFHGEPSGEVEECTRYKNPNKSLYWWDIYCSESHLAVCEGAVN